MTVLNAEVLLETLKNKQKKTLWRICLFSHVKNKESPFSSEGIDP